MSLLRLATPVVAVGVIVFLLSPLVFSIWVSFSPDSFLTPPVNQWSLRWYESFVQEVRWQRALVRSLILACQASLVAGLAGVPLAYSLARFAFPLRRMVEGAVLLPALIPPVALGLGLLFLTQTTSLKPMALIAAHALLGMPLVVFLAKQGFEQILPQWEAAARGLGASPLLVIWRVTLPLAWPWIGMGMAGAFVISLNESMIALFLTDPATETLPAVAWPQLRHAPTPLVAVASCASVAISMVAMLALIRLLSKKERKKGD